MISWIASTIFGVHYPLRNIRICQTVLRRRLLPSLKGVLSTLLVGFVVDAEEGFLEVIGHGKCWDRLLYNLQRLLLCGRQVAGSLQGKPANGLFDVNAIFFA